jgi:negative regulator of flagellin synthesis FlgM
MPPIEFDGARGLQPVRKVALTSGQPASTSVNAEGAVEAKPAMQIEAGQFEVGQPTVDSERVEQIRKAVESGSYPLLPARVADAMIAAGMFLRKGA